MALVIIYHFAAHVYTSRSTAKISLEKYRKRSIIFFFLLNSRVITLLGPHCVTDDKEGNSRFWRSSCIPE